MKRLASLILGSLLILTACGGPQAQQGPRLTGIYTGVVYSSGYALGVMGVDVTTSSGQLSGVGCFVAIDYSEACNTLSGSLYGTDATFRIGGLSFSGSTNGAYIDTTFRSSDGTVSGRVYFERDTGPRAANVPAGEEGAGPLSTAILDLIANPGSEN